MANDHFRDLLKAKLGDGAVSTFDAVLKDPELRRKLAIDDGGADDVAVETANQYVMDFIHGKNDGEALPPSLRPIFSGLREALNVSVRKADDLPGARKDEGTAETARCLARFKRDHSYKATLMVQDPDRLDKDADRYTLLRGVINESNTFRQSCEFELRAFHDDLFLRLKSDYDLIRPAVLKDPALLEELRTVEDYFYKAAREGAEQAKENRAKEAQITERLETKVRPQIEQQVRASMTRDLKGMLDHLGAPAEPDSTKTTTTATPPTAPAKP